jgi:hypothetical protein
VEELILISLRVVFAILWGLLEGLSYWPFDFGYERATSKCSTWFVLLVYFGLGCLMGGISLLIFPGTWLSEPWLRIVNLVTSPMFAGSVGIVSARRFYRRVDVGEPRDHFWPGFWFALGLSAVRFTYCER